MALIRNQYQTNFSGPLFGTFTTTTGGVAQNIPFGLTPSSIEAWNVTSQTTPGNALISSFYWQDTMPNASAFRSMYNATPVSVPGYISTNGVTPYETSDALKWVPNQEPYLTNGSTNLTITGITRGATTTITATHSFTSADNNVTWVTFHNIVGTTGLNTLRGKVISSTSTTSFVVDIDSTNMAAWVSGGQANVITGAPVTTQFGPQVIMTPQRDLGVAGLTLGTSLMVTTGDVWYFRAIWNDPTNG